MRIAFTLLLLAVVGCGAVTKAAANDPLKCERDPNCQGKRGRSMNCTTQCNDNVDCMRRCESGQTK